MSDNEDFMMSDGESYEFEFEEDEDEDVMSEGSFEGSEGNDDSSNKKDSQNVAENKYYQAKSIKQDDPEKAALIFESIFDIEEGSSEEQLVEYKFKTLKQLLKITYKLEKYDDFLAYFSQIFRLNLKKLSRSYLEDSLSRILDNYIGLPQEQELKFLELFINGYGPTNRLLLKAELKKVQVLVKLKKCSDVIELLKTLYHRLEEMPEVTRNAYLLELYSVEIQVYTEMENISRLKELYQKTLLVQSTIPHPKINAVIKEAGGKIYMRDELYDQASSEFYESFKSYDEIGNQHKRIQILKYLIVTSILSQNEINKFESQETKFFLKEPQVQKYIKLIKSFEDLKHEEFTDIFGEIVNDETSDKFLVQYLFKIEEVMKLKILIHYIKPFKRLSLQKLSDYLQLPTDKIESIFLRLRNNNLIPKVRLDLIEGVIYNE